MSETTDYPGPILRDYLYVDVDKVKSIAGQLESGVPEEARLTSKDARRTTVGWKGVLAYGPESGEEAYVQRSMLDSLFPELEDALEQGWLLDVSDIFHSSRADKFDQIKQVRPEGSIFRLTADGYLFDVRYFASLFASVSAAIGGYQDFERAQAQLAETGEPKKAEKGAQQRGGRGREPQHDGASTRLEDAVEQFISQYDMSPASLRSMVRTARGLFSPGLNLLMNTSEVGNRFTVTAALQENRRYFDASPEVIAARFGVSSQRWTIVATVGHYTAESKATDKGKLALAVENATADDFNRNRFVRTINSAITDMATTGLTELPQHPGMAAVPIAVYRTVRWTPPPS